MGLTYRGVSLQTDVLKFDLVSGLTSPALVRGEDDVIPGRSGRDPMAREKDIRQIRIEGHVVGKGATPAERSVSWRTATLALMAVMDLSLAPGTLTVAATGPGAETNYLGLATGTSKTIEARLVAFVEGPIRSHMSEQRWSFDLESVATPPDWT